MTARQKSVFPECRGSLVTRLVTKATHLVERAEQNIERVEGGVAQVLPVVLVTEQRGRLVRKPTAHCPLNYRHIEVHNVVELEDRRVTN